MKLVSKVFVLVFLLVGLSIQCFAQNLPFPEWVFKNHYLSTWNTGMGTILVVTLRDRNWQYPKQQILKNYPQEALVVIRSINGTEKKFAVQVRSEFRDGMVENGRLVEQEYIFRFSVSFKQEYHHDDSGRPYIYNRPTDINYDVQKGDKLILYWWGRRWETKREIKIL